LSSQHQKKKATKMGGLAEKDNGSMCNKKKRGIQKRERTGSGGLERGELTFIGEGQRGETFFAAGKNRREGQFFPRGAGLKKGKFRLNGESGMRKRPPSCVPTMEQVVGGGEKRPKEKKSSEQQKKKPQKAPLPSERPQP